MNINPKTIFTGDNLPVMRGMNNALKTELSFVISTEEERNQ